MKKTHIPAPLDQNALTFPEPHELIAGHILMTIISHIIEVIWKACGKDNGVKTQYSNPLTLSICYFIPYKWRMFPVLGYQYHSENSLETSVIHFALSFMVTKQPNVWNQFGHWMRIISILPVTESVCERI